MNRSANITGFTLIELIVVISIISFLLFFSLPSLSRISLFQENKSTVQDLAELVSELKKKALQSGVDHQMHIDISQGRVWTTDDTMDDAARENALVKAPLLSSDISVQDVQFQTLTIASGGVGIIRFSKQGYSDFAQIHLLDNDKPMTVQIEPFLYNAIVVNGRIEFENCE